MRKDKAFCAAMVLLGLISLLAAERSLALMMPVAKSAASASVPQHTSPSETPVPGMPNSERVEPPHGKTEQYTLSEDRYEKAVAYSRAGYTLYFVSYFVSVAVLLLLLRLGVAAKFRDIAERATGRRWLQAFVFVPLLIFTSDIFDLPVRLYWHALSLRYEQSVQRWDSWFWDWTKEELVGTCFALILALILFAAIRRSPRRWWLYFWFAALPILLGIVFINPLVIDPLFHKF
jgi:STE24 endopeptidase